MERLCKKWVLFDTPLNCDKDMMEKVSIQFDHNGDVAVRDTTNGARGKYVLTPMDNKSGTIRIVHNRWSEKRGLWKSKENNASAAMVDKFIYSLIKNPFAFVLESNILKVYHKGKEYKFKQADL